MKTISPQIQDAQQSYRKARSWWLTSVILATQKAEIRKIKVQSQPGQIVLETLYQKYPSQKKGW
jgi:hypothetical protein